MEMNDSPAPELLQQLQMLIQASAASIVISSTWRLVKSKNAQLQEILAGYGLSTIGDTPDLSRGCAGDRVDEIFRWLEDQRQSGDRGVDAWIAVDDVNLIAQNPKLQESNFVFVDETVGLSQS